MDSVNMHSYSDLERRVRAIAPADKYGILGYLLSDRHGIRVDDGGSFMIDGEFSFDIGYNCWDAAALHHIDERLCILSIQIYDLPTPDHETITFNLSATDVKEKYYLQSNLSAGLERYRREVPESHDSFKDGEAGREHMAWLKRNGIAAHTNSDAGQGIRSLRWDDFRVRGLRDIIQRYQHACDAFIHKMAYRSRK